MSRTEKEGRKMKAKFLSAFVVVALLNIDSARSGELYSDYCYQTTAVPSNGYYLAGNTMGPSTNYQSYSEVPVTLTDSYCTSGNTYVIQPSNFAAPTTSALRGALGLVHTCSKCSSGYELETYSGPFVYGDGTDSIRCTYLTNLTVKRCVKQSSGDGGTTTGTCDSTNCVSDTSWTQYNTSVVKKTTRRCSADATVCNEYEEYRCAKGYVGPARSLTGVYVSWCKRCPSYVFTEGNQIFSFETTTADIGTTSFENCYVDAESNDSSFTTSIGTANSSYARDAAPSTSVMFGI